MKEDHEIDSFFDSTFNDTDLIKSAKRKSYFRITGVSLLVSICVVILLILLKIQLTPYFMNQKMIEKAERFVVFCHSDESYMLSEFQKALKGAV